jgi:hypothetical protein
MTKKNPAKRKSVKRKRDADQRDLRKIYQRLVALHDTYAERTFPDETREEWDRLCNEFFAVLDDLKERRDMLRSLGDFGGMSP